MAHLIKHFAKQLPLIASCALSLLPLSGCGSGSQDGTSAADTVPHESDVYSRMSVRLDPKLSEAERTLIVADLYQSLQYQISAEAGSYFDRIFHGTANDSVISYLNERIHYIISGDISPESRLVTASLAGVPARLQSTQVYTVALNVGPVLWFESLLAEPEKLAFDLGDSQVPILSSRVGIVQIHDGYTLNRDGQYVFPTVFRVSALVHEGRHSDCTGGLAQADLDAMKDDQIPHHHECGHLHVVCPSGHSYEGSAACDDHAWGAYAIQAVFAEALAEDCTPCDSDEKMVAHAIAADALSRVLVSDSMLDGKLGDPDMSSGGLLSQ